MMKHYWWGIDTWIEKRVRIYMGKKKREECTGIVERFNLFPQDLQRKVISYLDENFGWDEFS